MLKNLIRQLAEKKILILGFGKEGIDNYLALRKLFPQKVLGIADKKELKGFELRIKNLLKKDKNLKLHLGENYLAKIGDYDLIIKTPGIALKVYEKFLKKGSVITSQTGIFFDNFPGIIVGITGTKGKGTTSSLIYSILKKAGLPVYFGGNIGQPVFQKLIRYLNLKGTIPSQIVRGSSPNVSVFVYEMSSHQLQDLKKSPKIAVFLNLFCDHLDYYKNQKEYEAAKANIAKYQTKNDFLIFNANDSKVKAISQKSKAQKVPFSLKRKQQLFKIIGPSDIKLAGDFNLLNIMAALEVAKIFQIKQGVIRQAIKNFEGLPHRLEFIGRFKGIEFFNDSMSTIPEVAIVALEAFKGKVATLMVGGSDKGSDYSDLAKQIVKSKVKNLIVLGQGTGERIIRELERESRRGQTPKKLNKTFIQARRGLTPAAFSTQILQANTMQEAVKIAFDKTPKGKVCLLSPGSASFNIFKDYQDRGNQFKKFVKWFGKGFD